jgi:hypothetical protein
VQQTKQINNKEKASRQAHTQEQKINEEKQNRKTQMEM